MKLSDRVRNAKVDAAVDEVDAGSGTNGTLQLWSGAQPTNPTDTPSGDLLAEFDLDSPAFGDASSGSASAAGLNKTATGTAAAGSGTTVGFARAADTDGTGLWDDDDVGTSGSSVQLDNTSIAENQDVTLSGWTYTQPAQ